MGINPACNPCCEPGSSSDSFPGSFSDESEESVIETTSGCRACDVYPHGGVIPKRIQVEITGVVDNPATVPPPNFTVDCGLFNRTWIMENNPFAKCEYLTDNWNSGTGNRAKFTFARIVFLGAWRYFVSAEFFIEVPTPSGATTEQANYQSKLYTETEWLAGDYCWNGTIDKQGLGDVSAPNAWCDTFPGVLTYGPN